MRHPTKVQSLAGSFDLRVATKIGRTMQRGLEDIAANCPRLCRSIIDVDVETIVRSSSRILAVALWVISGTGIGSEPAGKLALSYPRRLARPRFVPCPPL